MPTKSCTSMRRRFLFTLGVCLLTAPPSFAFVFGEPLPPLPPNSSPNPNPVIPGEPTPPPDVIPPGIPLPPPLNDLNPPDVSIQSFGEPPPDEGHSPSAAPEPATFAMALAGLGIVALAGLRRRRRRMA